MVSANFWLKVESRMILIVPLVVYSGSSSVWARIYLFWRRAISSARRMLANADECWVISSAAWISQDVFVIPVLCTQMCQERFTGSSVAG
jgi:hypothetical protein